MPKVLVTIAPLQPVADAILTGITHSSLLARPGQDAHSMVLSPSQAIALADAEIILMPDRKMSSVVTNLAARYEKKGVVVIALDELEGADPLPYEIRQPWLTDEEENHDSDEEEPLHDPHIWLDPLRMADIARPLAEAIAVHAPSLRGQLLANAETWKQHLRNELNPQLQAMLKPGIAKKRYDSRPFIPFVTSHSAYRYFLDRYDIKNNGALMLMPEDVTGARSSHDILARAGKVTIGCLIAEQETAMVKHVASASGARIVKLNPELLPERATAPAIDGLKDDYDRLLYETAAAFKGCL